nr:anaerobic C4-dicarboxylate transporter family protein [Citrobacter freundii]
MSVMNVIQEVAKDNGIRPSQPLSSAVVASQLGITASPISAATAIMYGTVEVMGSQFW